MNVEYNMPKMKLMSNIMPKMRLMSNIMPKMKC